MIKGTPTDLTKETPFFDSGQMARVRAEIDVARTGANNSTTRAQYAIYNSKSLLMAANFLPESKKISHQVAYEMDREIQRINGPDQIAVISRIQNTSWK